MHTCVTLLLCAYIPFPRTYNVALYTILFNASNIIIMLNCIWYMVLLCSNVSCKHRTYSLSATACGVESVHDHSNIRTRSQHLFVWTGYRRSSNINAEQSVIIKISSVWGETFEEYLFAASRRLCKDIVSLCRAFIKETLTSYGGDSAKYFVCICHCDYINRTCN